ncbi:hypothetical protein CDD82_6998 [Ophiocordyceps australis]|uniref:Ribosomal protein L1 n=1 Tax=Ophiocordyceps australis TaxID=1399860 RepID=A0A2C5XXQ9_9HYPO|nr:hypothetical protein CDD82_6998 [Ophiocordyceps australis]
MGPMDRCLASMARLSLAPRAPLCLARFTPPVFLQARHASHVPSKKRKKQKKRKLPKEYRRAELEKTDLPRFSLCGAMRLLRAVEVGQPAWTKYELHINLTTKRNGPYLTNTIRLPFPTKSPFKFGVICPEDSKEAKDAIAAGAIIVGVEKVFEQIRKEKFSFDRLICLEGECEKALLEANVASILGPRGLMPNKKLKTVARDPAKTITSSAGMAQYRERRGIINVPIGQINYTPDQLKANIHALMATVKADATLMSETFFKGIHEVILSTTHGPGVSLSGTFKDPDEYGPEALTGPL